MRHGNGRRQENVSCQLSGKRGPGGEGVFGNAYATRWKCPQPPISSTHLTHSPKPHFRSAPPTHRHFISVLVCLLIYWAPPDPRSPPPPPPPKGPTSTQYWNIPHPTIFDRLLLLRLRCSKRACKLNGWQLIENRKPLIWHICGLCLIYAVRTVYTVGSRCCGLMDCRLSFSQLTAALDNLCPQFRKVSRPVKYEVANRMAGRCRGISNFNAQIVANENV